MCKFVSKFGIFVFFFVFYSQVFSNTCLEFDGIDDYVYADSLQVTSSYTIELWFSTMNTTDAWLGGFYDPDNNDFTKGPNIGIQSDGILRYIHRIPSGDTGGTDLYSSVHVNDGEWHHAAIVFDGATQYLYVDGLLDTTCVATGEIAGYADLFMAMNGSGGSPRMYPGKIDDIRIWNTARTQSEIFDNMYEALTGNENGLIAYYDLEDGTGSAAGDKTGSHDAVLNNMDESDWVVSDWYKPFTHINAGLSGIYRGRSIFGDYDNDGDLDILSVGISGFAISKIYRNDSGIFTEVSAGLIGLYWSSADWGDYDNDGDLDIIITGYTQGGIKTSIIYRNESGSFINISAGLTGIAYGSTDWGDYDNDGDLDILISGSYISKIYSNDNGSFNDIGAGLTGFSYSSCNWGDYDNDGDLDIVISGYNGSSYTSIIYRNNNGVFTDINAGLITSSAYGSSEWGDYDSDGDLDLLITNGGHSIIYRNDSGIFTNISSDLPSISFGQANWGDYDNDGDLDILISGSVNSKIFKNDSGIFTDISAETDGVESSSSVWGDYDNDGDLDILLSGDTGEGSITRIYRNNCINPNTIASSPQNLTYINSGSSITFSWDPGSDNETPQAGLSYNLYISTVSLGDNINNSMSDNSTGYRKIVSLGNVSELTSWKLDKNLPVGKYYWSVQTVDNGFTGSEFAEEESFDIYFEEYASGLPAVKYGAVEWGDYDNDGDLDVLISGSSASGDISSIYRNDSGAFTDIGAGLLTMNRSRADWGDYDNDGDLDIVLMGYSYFGAVAVIYRNDSGVFTDAGANIEGGYEGSVKWGDYDNDGDLDIAVSAIGNTVQLTKIYRNDSGIFIDIGASLNVIVNGEVAWGDYDNDGDLDLFSCGQNMTYGALSNLYRNDSGIFTDTGAGIENVAISSADWGDYDNDGDLDLVISGYSYLTYQTVCNIYRNDSGVFSNIAAGLEGLWSGDTSWGDFDNDGDLDILVSGGSGSLNSAYIYRNDSGLFTNMQTGFSGARECVVRCADHDNDGDLDAIVTGISGEDKIFHFYENFAAVPNTLPEPPALPGFSVVNDSITVSYEAGNDNETPSNGLSYNLKFILNGNIVKSSESDTDSGYRKVVKIGNLGQDDHWCFNKEIKVYPQTVYDITAKLQSVDNCFAGSEFSVIDTVFTGQELKTVSLPVMGPEDELLWEYLNGSEIVNYVVQTDDDIDFSSYYEDSDIYPTGKQIITKDGKLYFNLALGSLSFIDSLKDNKKYYWRVKPVYDIAGESWFNEDIKSFIYNDSPNTPSPPLSGFSPSSDELTTTTPMISWGNAPDPDGHSEDLMYILELDSVNTFNSIMFNDTTSAGITYSQVSPALPDGFRYFYRIKTVDAELLESGWSATQQFITLMPPQSVKISNDGVNITVDWDDMPINTKGVVYTVYGSDDPYSGWQPVATQLSVSELITPISESKKFYKVTAGSSSKIETETSK